MSGTTITTAPATPVSATNSLANPTFIMAIISMIVVASTAAVVLWRGDDGNIKLVLGFVLGSMGGPVIQFYFGSSKSSQAKDEKIDAPGTTTTVAPTPMVVTTTPTTTGTAG
jgi:hypothetical protein